MIRWIVTVALGVTLSSPALADGMTAQQLRTLCAAQAGTKERLTCSGYIVGYVDGVVTMVALASSPKPWCVKDDVLENTFLRYSLRHPEEDSQLAAITIYEAMTEAYPCKGK